MPEEDDEIGFEAAGALAAATADGRPLLAAVQWRSRPVPGSRETPPVPATAHVLLTPAPAASKGSADGGGGGTGAGKSVNERLLRAGLARLERARGHQVHRQTMARGASRSFGLLCNLELVSPDAAAAPRAPCAVIWGERLF